MKKPALEDKSYLNLQEAVDFYGLSRRKLNRYLKENEVPFLAYYGNRKLIIRDAFETYIEQFPFIMETLKADPAYLRKNDNTNLGEKGTYADKFTLTMAEAADYFSLDRKSLKKLVEENVGSLSVRSGKRYLIIKDKMEKYILGKEDTL